MKISMLAALAVVYGLNQSAVPALERNDPKNREFGREDGEGQQNNRPPISEEGLAVVMNYADGAAPLAREEYIMLSEFINRAVSYGDIEVLYVAVWSDKFFHVNSADILTSNDSMLAANRIDALKKFFQKKYDWLNVTFYNMGKGVSIFSKLVGTKEARLKAIVSGIKLNGSIREFQQIANFSSPSTAVIVARLTDSGFKEYRRVRKSSEFEESDNY